MNRFSRTPLFAAIAVAAGLGVARAAPDGGSDAGPATLPIAGVVRDEQGRPIPAVWIEREGYRRPGVGGPPAWSTDAHGRFLIEDAPRGPVTLLVMAGKWLSCAKKKVVETRAGVRDLVIVLDPGPQLLLRIVGYVPGRREEYARVTWQEPDKSREVRHAPVRDDGWTRFVALPPDREFEMWVQVEDNGRLVRARGLKPGESERRIEPEEFKDIAGKVRASQETLEQRIENARGPLREHLDVEVHAHPGFLVRSARAQSDGSFRVRGLPPGEYIVSVTMFFDGYRPPVWKRVEAGTTDVVFDLDERR